MKKLLLTLMSLIIFQFGIIAQNENEINNLIDNATIIVEGEIVEQIPFVFEKNNLVYTNNKIRINKIFKGQSTTDYFNIITIGGDYQGEIHSWSHQFSFSKEAYGIFFLQSPVQPVSFENENCYELENGKTGFVPFIPNSEELSPKAVFDNKNVINDIPKQLYEVIENRTGIIRQKRSKNPYERNISQLLTIESEDCVEYHILNLEIIENSSLNETTSYTVEFDIKIRSLQDDFSLEKVDLSMEYSTALFGSNVVSNNHITVSLGGDLSNYQSTLTDETSSKVKVEIEKNVGTNALTIDNYGKQLYHAVIQIENFDPIEILQLAVDENFDISTYKIEDEVVSELLCNIFNDDIIGPISDFFTPSISSISPNSAPAGTRFVHSLITIIGDDFGNERGESRVNFKVLDGVGYEWCAPLDGDYIVDEWSNTQIKLLVPSYAKPPEFTDGQVDFMTLQKPGSGIVRIDKVVDGMHIYSSDTNPNAHLDIPYSVRNDKRFYSEGYKGQPEFMFNQNTNGGYTIRFSNEFKFIHDDNGNNTGVLRTVDDTGETYVDIAKEVAEEWQCLTGLNFIVDEDTQWFEQFGCDGDGNIIGLHYDLDQDIFNSDLMSTTARTYPSTTCMIPGIDIEPDFLRCSEIWVVKEEFDNENPPPGVLENSKERFFNAMLHEFGHAHFLNHVSDLSELMRPNLLSGASATITPNAVTASRHIQDFSEVHSCESGAYISHECYDPNSIEEVAINPENWFKVYTNSENIIIQNINALQVEDIKLFDIVGRLHSHYSIHHSNEIIRIPRVRSPGIYIVAIRDKANFLYTFKISQL